MKFLEILAALQYGALSVKCPQHIFGEFASASGCFCVVCHTLLDEDELFQRQPTIYTNVLKMLSSYMRRISIQKPFNLVLNCNFGGDFVYRPTEFTMSCNRKMSPTMCQGISKNNVAVFETLVKSTLEVLLALKCKFQTNIIYVMEFRCRCLT